MANAETLRRKDDDAVGEKPPLETTAQVSAHDSIPLQYQPPPGRPPGYSETFHPVDTQSAELRGNGQAPLEAHPVVIVPDNRPPPGRHAQQLGNNIGMEAGMVAAVGDGGGGNFAGDMLEGQMMGNFVGQQIGQAQKHAYYREQAMEFRQQRAASNTKPGDPSNVLVVDDGTREGRRAARRAQRWERRADRHDRFKNLFKGKDKESGKDGKSSVSSDDTESDKE